MFDQAINILYVDDLQESLAFYRRFLQREPCEASTNFAMFEIREGMLLGLWSRQALQPASHAAAGAGELAFLVASDGCVDQLHEAWKDRAATVPTRAEFGYNFLMQDPNGHRLRVMHTTKVGA